MSHPEPVPASVENAVRLRLRPGERELIRVASDLTPKGAFGNQWVIVTDQRVMIAPSADECDIRERPLTDGIGARTETRAGGGWLPSASKSAAPELAETCAA